MRRLVLLAAALACACGSKKPVHGQGTPCSANQSCPEGLTCFTVGLDGGGTQSTCEEACDSSGDCSPSCGDGGLGTCTKGAGLLGTCTCP